MLSQIREAITSIPHRVAGYVRENILCVQVQFGGRQQSAEIMIWPSREYLENQASDWEKEFYRQVRSNTIKDIAVVGFFLSIIFVHGGVGVLGAALIGAGSILFVRGQLRQSIMKLVRVAEGSQLDGPGSSYSKSISHTSRDVQEMGLGFAIFFLGLLFQTVSLMG